MKLTHALIIGATLVLGMAGKTAAALAIVDPLRVPNNQFGIHIVDENDLEDAEKLVNSNGGSWGYVTLVVTVNDRDTGKWQRTFDRMRTLKLIPVLRIATQLQGGSWQIPDQKQIDDWVSFLSSLNWVIQNRYVVLFNEPNHTKEWGNTIDPVGYAKTVIDFRDKLKSKSEDFFVLPAGLDQSANNAESTMDAITFYQKIYRAEPSYFSKFDGWTIHAYPNPDFSASPESRGRGSIHGADWERAILSKYGVSDSIPLFITETGWKHNAETISASFNSPETVASYFQQAFTSAWDTGNIVMISPFLLNYQAEPFNLFSWKKPNNEGYYPQYEAVKTLPKKAGAPIQLDRGTLELNIIPNKFLINSLYFLSIGIRNTGQRIWTISDGLTLTVSGTSKSPYDIPVSITKLAPFETKQVKVAFRTPETEGAIPIVFSLKKSDVILVSDAKKIVTVAKPETIWGKTMLWLRTFLTKNK